MLKLFYFGAMVEKYDEVNELDKKLHAMNLHKLRTGHLWIKLAGTIAVLFSLWKMGGALNLKVPG